MLRPVGKFFAGERDQPRYGVHHRVLWYYHHRRKFGTTTQSPTPGADPVVHSTLQLCFLTLYRALRLILYTPPGMSIEIAAGPPYPLEEIIRWAVFQLLVAFADVAMVLPLPQVHPTTYGH